jgi:hypothetical protein
MITIFTIPKPFKGHINIIQRNAIQSWLKLYPKCEIILFGDDKGVSSNAIKLGVIHIPTIKKTEFGTPLLSSAFDLARKIAKNDILTYINTDIILPSNFVLVVKKIKKPLFLMTGRRWDVDIEEEIDFSSYNWEIELIKKAKNLGKIHGMSGMDYFVFPRCLLDKINMPEFIVGRPGWDNWLIYKCRFLNIPVIDVTEIMTIFHQNHNSSHIQIKEDISKKIEAQRNIKLAGGLTNMCTIRDADWILTRDGLRRPPYPRRIFSQLSLFYPWRFVLALKRKLWQIISNLFQ